MEKAIEPINYLDSDVEIRRKTVSQIKKDVGARTRSGANKKTGIVVVTPPPVDTLREKAQLEHAKDKFISKRGELSEKDKLKFAAWEDEIDQSKKRFTDKPVQVYDKDVAPREHPPRDRVRLEAIKKQLSDYYEEQYGEPVPENIFVRTPTDDDYDEEIVFNENLPPDKPNTSKEKPRKPLTKTALKKQAKKRRWGWW